MVREIKNSRDERSFVDFAGELQCDHIGCVALEFSTERDMLQAKTTDTPSGRYVDLVHFFSGIQTCGFDVLNSVSPQPVTTGGREK